MTGLLTGSSAPISARLYTAISGARIHARISDGVGRVGF